MKASKGLILSLLALGLGIGSFNGVSNIKSAQKVEASTVSEIKRTYLNVSSFNSWTEGNASFRFYYKMNSTDVCNCDGVKIDVNGSSDKVYVFTNNESYNKIYVNRRSPAGDEGWNGFDIDGSNSKNVIKVSDWNSGNFDDSTYNIYYESVTSSEGGSATITRKAGTTGLSSGYFYNHNGLKLDAVADEGYSFVKWQRDGVDVDGAGANYTIDTIGSDSEWRAIFAPIQKYTVIFKNNLGEDISTEKVVSGNAATLPATPESYEIGNTRYTFAKWVDVNGQDLTSALANVQEDLIAFPAYSESYKNGRYIYGTLDGENCWSAKKGIYSSWNSSENQDEWTVNFAIGDVFMVVWYEDGNTSDYKGYSVIDSSSSPMYCFTKDTSSDGYDNIIINVAGEYKIFYKNGTIYVANNANLLASKLNSFSDEAGTCKNDDRYPAMKAIFNSLSANQKQSFMNDDEYASAYSRLSAWAIANNEEITVNGIVAKNKYNPLTGEYSYANVSETDSIALIMAVSAISGAALLGIYLFKKKKHI